MTANSATPPTPTRPDVLVAGPYFCDLIFHNLARPIGAGTEVYAETFALLPGGTYTLAMALHRLQHTVVWATDFGTDPLSRLVRDAARREGLNDDGFRHHDQPLVSVTVALSDQTDRTMVSYQDKMPSLDLADLVREHRPRWLAVPYLAYDRASLDALTAAHEMGAKVFMDCQDVSASLTDPAVRQALALTTAFAPNAPEAIALTGAATVADAIDVLAQLCDTVVITQGADGATVQRGHVRHRVPGISVAALDTTGAGDCFNGGFLHGLLQQQEILACATTAVACGAAATTALGSAGALHLEDLRDWLTSGLTATTGGGAS